MRHSYSTDPTLIERVFPLLETAFPGIAAQARRVVMQGARWEENSTPFLVEENGRLIAHIGVLPISMTIAGRAVRVGGIHAVCTHPGHRRHGHFRRLMGEVLGWCDGQFETLLLFTDQPHLYAPFGFRPIQEHRFVVEPVPAATPPPAPRLPLRPLDFSTTADLLLLDGLLTSRAPVSRLVGITSERGIFSYHCPGKGLLYSESLNAILWTRVEGGTLHLIDIIGPRIPTLREILLQWPAYAASGPITRVEIAFSPDQLDITAAAIPCPPELMVRGPFAAEGLPFMVPPSARC